MLEASYCDTVVTVSPFMGAIGNECYNFHITPDITKVFTQYVDLVNIIVEGINT